MDILRACVKVWNEYYYYVEMKGKSKEELLKQGD